MSIQTYADAVAKFVELAQHRTGGGRVAAQVLLSAYNGYDFQTDIADLGTLDRQNFETAMVIIRGRYETGMEPDKLVANGSKVFRALWDQWIFLQVKERAKMECPRCNGRGEIYSSDSDEDVTPCSFCGGMGRVCECRLQGSKGSGGDQMTGNQLGIDSKLPLCLGAEQPKGKDGC